mgnify:CR=1 FL=1
MSDTETFQSIGDACDRLSARLGYEYLTRSLVPTRVRAIDEAASLGWDVTVKSRVANVGTRVRCARLPSYTELEAIAGARGVPTPIEVTGVRSTRLRPRPFLLSPMMRVRSSVSRRS